MIDLLGLVVFGTIVGIGLLDGRSGLTVFARYRSVDVTDLRRRVAARKAVAENDRMAVFRRGEPPSGGN